MSGTSVSLIGVAAAAQDLPIVAEFFELFKTPWEPAAPGRRYSAVVATDGQPVDWDAPLIIAFGSTRHSIDASTGIAVEQVSGPVELTSHGERFPVYGSVARFDAVSCADRLTAAGRCVEYHTVAGTRTVVRIGYDLFAETRRLLQEGQPVAYAATPTLEHHIAVLRRILQTAGVGYVEIPPRPAGFEYACCLTHDLDFFGIRRHAGDRTLAGFIMRASIGSIKDVFRGKRSAAEATRNLLALAALPLVFLRIVPDLWRPFDDYAEAERGLPSTFFLVPVKGKAGVGPDGVVREKRAVAYQISDIAQEIGDSASRGSEMAVHGIDAWRDADEGRRELAQLAAVTGQARTGVRMHWLYFTDRSPREIERAGYDFDSTYGYNNAIGFRPGTSQVFCIPGTGLMELPLSIMDSALFFEDRMALSRPEAQQRCREILDHARRFGGTVVVNWHDRSLAPERQWRQPYMDLLAQLRDGNKTWFSTASQAVNWFRWRRSISFRADGNGRVTMCAPEHDAALPPVRVSVNRSTGSSQEMAYDGRVPMTVEL